VSELKEDGFHREVRVPTFLGLHFGDSNDVGPVR
jgi:hypothetical protein